MLNTAPWVRPKDAMASGLLVVAITKSLRSGSEGSRRHITWMVCSTALEKRAPPAPPTYSAEGENGAHCQSSHHTPCNTTIISNNSRTRTHNLLNVIQNDDAGIRLVRVLKGSHDCVGLAVLTLSHK